MQEVVIVGAVRTPIGSFRGVFSTLSAVDLGTGVVRSLLARCSLPATAVDELIFGQVLTAGCGQNPARQTALRAGLPVSCPAVTVNLVCGSGLKAVQQAVQAIRSGDAQVVIAGGQESMSNAPYLIDGARAGLRVGHRSMQDSMIQDGLWDAFNDYHMGVTAENLADRYAIDRQRQDAFAAGSQQKAAAAIEAGRFEQEIVRWSSDRESNRRRPLPATSSPVRPPRQSSCAAAPCVPRGKRHRHRRQRLFAQRRRGGGTPDERRQSPGAGAAGTGTHCQQRRGGRRSGGHGDWPRQRLRDGAGTGRMAARRGGFN